MFLPIFLSTMYETRTALAPNTIRSQIWMLPSKRVCVIYQAFIMHFSKLLNIQTTSITLTVISTMEAADTACRGSWQLVGWRHWKKKGCFNICPCETNKRVPSLKVCSFSFNLIVIWVWKWRNSMGDALQMTHRSNSEDARVCVARFGREPPTGRRVCLPTLQGWEREGWKEREEAKRSVDWKLM